MDLNKKLGEWSLNYVGVDVEKLSEQKQKEFKEDMFRVAQIASKWSLARLIYLYQPRLQEEFLKKTIRGTSVRGEQS